MASPTQGSKADLTLRAICGELERVRHEWFRIGIQLGIPRDTLKQFEKENDPLSAVIDYWLKRNVTEPVVPISWNSIVSALKTVGEAGLAEQIKAKYCQCEGTKAEKATGESSIEARAEQAEQTQQQNTEVPNDSSSHQPSSASPDGSMDPAVKEDLEFILERNLKEILIKYASYTDYVRATIQEKGITVEELCYYLLHLPACDKTHQGQNLTLLADKKVELEKCDTITAIFTFLTTECASFLNYEIFQVILKHYKIPEDQDDLKYSEHLKAFIEKHKISELVKCIPKFKPKKGSKELVLKYDIENTCRLAKITNLKKSVSEIFGLLPSALEIIDIKDDCVIVTFYIPASVADAIFTSNTVLLPQQEDELRNASVRWLKCNGYTFHFGKEELIKNAALERIEEQLNCSVCLDTYTDPKQLQCHHVFCQKCLVKLVIKDQQGQRTLTCPSCRQVTPVPASGVAGLQSAFQISKILEIVEEHRKEKVATYKKVESASTSQGSISVGCSKHEGRQMELYCDTCEEMICLKCIIKGEKHHSHHYEELFERYKKEIVSSLEPIEKQLVAIGKALAVLDVRCGEVSEQRMTTKADIHKAMRQLRETIDLRETELIGQVDQLAESKLKNLAVQRDQLETTQAQLSNCLYFMTENLKPNNQEEVMMKKSTTLTQVKELTTIFQRNMLEPNTEADMIFFALTDLTAECQKYGQVSVADPPDPSKCYATGKGLETATVEKSTVVLRAVSSNSQPAKLSTHSITCKLVSETTGDRSTGSVERRGLGLYEISYQPTIKGRHQLHIKIQGQHIRGSPFSLSVRSTVEKLGTPILVVHGLRESMGVAVNKKGEMVVTGGGKRCVTVLSPGGGILRSFGTRDYGNIFLNPNGVALDKEGNIFVADSVKHSIQKFTADGNLLKQVHIEGDKDVTFYPTGVAYNTSNGRVYVVNSSHIQILNSDLSNLRSFGTQGHGKGQVYFPRHIACDTSGNIYVADGLNHRIQVFTAEGKFLRMFGKYGEGMGELKDPYGIAVDSSDKVYVSECNNGRVSVFTSEGQFVMSFGSKGGQFTFPHGLAVDASGVVYTCDECNGIQLF